MVFAVCVCIAPGTFHPITGKQEALQIVTKSPSLLTPGRGPENAFQVLDLYWGQMEQLDCGGHPITKSSGFLGPHTAAEWSVCPARAGGDRPAQPGEEAAEQALQRGLPALGQQAAFLPTLSILRKWKLLPAS